MFYMEEHKPQILSEQLREISERTVDKEKKECLNIIHSHLINRAENGFFTAKRHVSRKLVEENDFISFLESEIGEGMKISICERHKNPINCLVIFDWRKPQ